MTDMIQGKSMEEDGKEEKHEGRRSVEFVNNCRVDNRKHWNCSYEELDEIYNGQNYLLFQTGLMSFSSINSIDVGHDEGHDREKDVEDVEDFASKRINISRQRKCFRCNKRNGKVVEKKENLWETLQCSLQQFHFAVHPQSKLLCTFITKNTSEHVGLWFSWENSPIADKFGFLGTDGRNLENNKTCDKRCQQEQLPPEIGSRKNSFGQFEHSVRFFEL